MFDYDNPPDQNFGKRVYSQFRAVPAEPFIKTERTMSVHEVIYHLKKHIGMVRFYFYVSSSPPTAFSPTGMPVSREHIIRFMEDKQELYAFYCFKLPDTKVIHVEVSHILDKAQATSIQTKVEPTTSKSETVETTEDNEEGMNRMDPFLSAEMLYIATGSYPPGWNPNTPIPPEYNREEILRDREAARLRHNPRPKKAKPFVRLSEDEFDALSQEQQEVYEAAERLYDSNNGEDYD